MSVKFEIRKRKLPTCSSHCCGARHGQQQPQQHLHSHSQVALSHGFTRVDPDQEDEEFEDQHQMNKTPRLLLEDHQAKSKRLREEGNVLAEAGRFRAAMARWSEALEVDSENALLYELMAQASMQLEEDFQAIQYATQATKFGPDWADGFLTLSRSHFNYGELQLALDSLDKAVALGVQEDVTEERDEIVSLLAKQQQILAQKQSQLDQTQDPDHAQVICCMKHLNLRATTSTTTPTVTTTDTETSLSPPRPLPTPTLLPPAAID